VTPPNVVVVACDIGVATAEEEEEAIVASIGDMMGETVAAETVGAEGAWKGESEVEASLLYARRLMLEPKGKWREM
jgi:hypothetical protein